MPSKLYNIRFNYQRLREDIGMPLSEIAPLFQKYYGVHIEKNSVYAWFSRGEMRVERLLQLLGVVRLETNRKLDYWRYVKCTERTNRAA